MPSFFFCFEIYLIFFPPKPLPIVHAVFACKQQTYLCCASKYIMSGQIALGSRWRMQYKCASSSCERRSAGAFSQCRLVNGLHCAQHSFVWLNYKLVYHLDFFFSNISISWTERDDVQHEFLYRGKIVTPQKLYSTEHRTEKITTFVTITINLILPRVCARHRSRAQRINWH